MSELDLTAEAAELIELYGEDREDHTKLHPDLEPYYEASGGDLKWPMLRSPFVFQVPFMSWKLANKSYEFKRRAYDEALVSGNIAKCFAMLERPFRLQYLNDFWERKIIDRPMLRELLEELWIDTELPYQFGQTCKRLFKAATHHLGPILQEPLPSYKHGILKIFRGGEAGHAHGLSWTLDHAKAKWFARRWGKRMPTVWSGEIGKDDIFAYFTQRGEAEIVVDPNFIRKLKVEMLR